MRLIYTVIFLMTVFFTMPAYAEPLSDGDITFSSEEVSRGDMILVSIRSDSAKAPSVTWMKKEISLVFNKARSSWQGFLAVDLTEKPGTYKAVVQSSSEGFQKGFDIRVVDKEYGVRNLTLPTEKVELDAESLKRVREETAAVNALWAADITIPEWDNGFVMPVDNDVVGTFGKRSVINNLERSPHTGVDLRGSTGDTVKATAKGRVVLIADHFFTGNSLYLDHGGGIISMYFHLDKILVRDGDTVEKGQTIGLVGSTGRATGPHLHWGVRINGARVNPLTLIDISRGLEE